MRKPENSCEKKTKTKKQKNKKPNKTQQNPTKNPTKYIVNFKKIPQWKIWKNL